MRSDDWDDTFMMIARDMSRMGTCPRAKVGAVLVSQDHRILSTGFNGAPSKQPHCLDVGCILGPSGTCLRTVHAEVNAITRAPNGIPPESTLYVTLSPCFSCATLILNSGIYRVVYANEYHPVDGVPDPLDFLLQAKMVVSHVPI